MENTVGFLRDGVNHFRLCNNASNERNVMKCGALKSNEDMILALAGQFKQLSHARSVTSQLSWLEHCTGIKEVMGSNLVESPEFFRFMSQLLKLSSKCEDHIFI